MLDDKWASVDLSSCAVSSSNIICDRYEVYIRWLVTYDIERLKYRIDRRTLIGRCGCLGRVVTSLLIIHDVVWEDSPIIRPAVAECVFDYRSPQQNMPGTVKLGTHYGFPRAVPIRHADMAIQNITPVSMGRTAVDTGVQNDARVHGHGYDMGTARGHGTGSV